MDNNGNAIVLSGPGSAAASPLCGESTINSYRNRSETGSNQTTQGALIGRWFVIALVE